MCSELSIPDTNICIVLISLSLRGLHEHKLTSLPDGLFKDLDNLVQLSFYTNHVINLKSNIFRNLNKLKILDVFDNKFMSLPYNILHNVVNLEYLFV